MLSIIKEIDSTIQMIVEINVPSCTLIVQLYAILNDNNLLSLLNHNEKIIEYLIINEHYTSIFSVELPYSYFTFYIE